MNGQKLKGEIVSAFGSQNAFSEAVGWHKNKVSKIVKGKYKPNTDEVAVIVSALRMSTSTFAEIFLPSISPNGEITSLKSGGTYEQSRVLGTQQN